MGRVKANRVRASVQIPLCLTPEDEKELRRLWLHFGMDVQKKAPSAPAFILLLCRYPVHIRIPRLRDCIKSMSKPEIEALVKRLGW